MLNISSADVKRRRYTMKNFLKALVPSFVIAFGVSYVTGLVYGSILMILSQRMSPLTAWAIAILAAMGVLFGAYKLIMKVIACRG